MLCSFEATRQGLPCDNDYDELDQLGEIIEEAKKNHMKADQLMIRRNLVLPHAVERNEKDDIFRRMRRTEKFKAQMNSLYGQQDYE